MRIRKPAATVQKSATLLGGMVVVVVALTIPAAPAFADNKCPANQTFLPYSGGDPPFQCAQMEYSDKKSLNPGQSKTWSKSMPLGYNDKYDCLHPNDSAVTVTALTGTAFFSATGTNWGTGDHSFGAGVLFTTGAVDDAGYVKNSCDKTGAIKTSIQKMADGNLTLSGYDNATQYVSQAVTATMSDTRPTGSVLLYVNIKNPDKNSTPAANPGQLSGGKATISWTPALSGSQTVTALYAGDTSACPSRDSHCGWMPMQSDVYNTTVAAGTAPVAATAGLRVRSTAPLASPFAPARRVHAAAPTTAPELAVTTLTKTRRAPTPTALACPRGNVLLDAESLAAVPIDDAAIAASLHGARIRTALAPRHRIVSLQVTCRAQSAPLVNQGRVGLGTAGADHLTTSARSGASAFGGPGNDTIELRSRNGVANGGLGNDAIVLAARSGVANGAPGDDRLVARTTDRALLIGGTGHDTLIGGDGPTIINAKDGERDTVTCNSSRNRVLVDHQDVVNGPCQPLVKK